MGPTGHYLTLRFGTFTLQSTPGCTADYVEIREYDASGTTTSNNKKHLQCRNSSTNQDIAHVPYAANGNPLPLGHVLGKHCGTALPASVDTSDSFAFVKFVSDSSGNAAGFSLAFEASVEGTVKVSRVLLSWVSAQS